MYFSPANALLLTAMGKGAQQGPPVGAVEEVQELYPWELRPISANMQDGLCHSLFSCQVGSLVRSFDA